MALSHAALSGLVVLLLCSSIMGPIATALSAPVFAVVASLAEAVTQLPSVLQRERNVKAVDLARKEADLVVEKAARAKSARVASEAIERAAAAEVKLATATKKISEMTGKLSKTEAALLEARKPNLTYRGQKRRAADAVADTSKRVASRVKRVLNADIAAMAGEAVPYVGVAVIVGATTYDLQQSCELAHDLYELDVAFNPEHAINDAGEICGMRVPTPAEIWRSAKMAPGAAIEAAIEVLPEFHWQAGWDDLIEHFPTTAELDATAGAVAEALGGWLPEFYWQEGWDDLTGTASEAKAP